MAGMRQLGGHDQFSRSSQRTLANGSFSEAWAAPTDMFSLSNRMEAMEDEEEQLLWAAIERLPTYDRLRKGVVSHVGDGGRVVKNEIDLGNLGGHDKKKLIDMVIKFVDQGNEKFLRRVRERIDRLYFASEPLCHL